MNVNRIAGSPVEMNGTVNVSNSKMGITADTVFGSQNALSFAGAASALNMQGETRIEQGATLLGNGTLTNGTGGSMILENGANVLVHLLNRSDLEIGDGIGQAMVKSYQQTSDGRLQLDLAGTTPGIDHDRLVAISAVALDGGTPDISPDAGSYQDPASFGTYDEFHLMTSASLSGQFDRVWYDAAELGWDFVSGDTLRSHEADGLFRIVEYAAEDLFLVNYRALEGDANGDGFVDAQDFTIWNANKFTAGTDWTTGDFTGDGMTDGADFALWNANKFTGVGFGLNAVPEPSAALLSVLGLALVAWRRRV